MSKRKTHTEIQCQRERFRPCVTLPPIDVIAIPHAKVYETQPHLNSVFPDPPVPLGWSSQTDPHSCPESPEIVNGNPASSDAGPKGLAMRGPKG